jgi:hypothetical protein
MGAAGKPAIIARDRGPLNKRCGMVPAHPDAHSAAVAALKPSPGACGVHKGCAQVKPETPDTFTSWLLAPHMSLRQHAHGFEGRGASSDYMPRQKR